jgi:hypothetical protein
MDAPKSLLLRLTNLFLKSSFGASENLKQNVPVDGYVRNVNGPFNGKNSDFGSPNSAASLFRACTYDRTRITTFAFFAEVLNYKDFGRYTFCVQNDTSEVFPSTRSVFPVCKIFILLQYPII